MHKSILISIDLSHTDRAAPMIALARNVADEGARVTLMYVVEDVPTYVAAELPGGVIDKAKERAREQLKEVARANGLESAHIEVRSGQAATAILGVAKENKADLIIVASHRPGLQDYLIGSTAARVVRHAKCTVMVMR